MFGHCLEQGQSARASSPARCQEQHGDRDGDETRTPHEAMAKLRDFQPSGSAITLTVTS